MKKTLLSIALMAGFTGLASAESSVTLYGLLDAGYGFDQTKVTQGNQSVRVRNTGATSGGLSGNRWGLRGSEDLGNGTSAIFRIESGFDITNGGSGQDGRLFGRQAIIGLSNDQWGTVTLGRQFNPGDDYVSILDPFQDDGGYLTAARNTFGDSLSDWYDNSFKYMSPDWNGFSFGLGAVIEDNKKKSNGITTSTNRTSGASIAAGYTNGPLYLAANFEYLRQKNDTLALNSNTKAWNIGAVYDFDAVKLHLMYGGQRDGVFGSAGYLHDLSYDLVDGSSYSDADINRAFGPGLRQHSWLAGVSAPVGEAGEFLFSYQGSQMKNKSLKSSYPLGGTFGDLRKANSHIFSLGYTHDLSKRTLIYALGSYGFSNVKYDHNTLDRIKVKSSKAVLGIQHRF